MSNKTLDKLTASDVVEFRKMLSLLPITKSKLEVMKNELEYLSMNKNVQDDIHSAGMQQSTLSDMPSSSNRKKSVTEQALDYSKEFDNEIKNIKQEINKLTLFVNNIDMLLDSLNQYDRFIVDRYMKGVTHVNIANEYYKQYNLVYSARGLERKCKKIIKKLFNMYKEFVNESFFH